MKDEAHKRIQTIEQELAKFIDESHGIIDKKIVDAMAEKAMEKLQEGGISPEW